MNLAAPGPPGSILAASPNVNYVLPLRADAGLKPMHSYAIYAVWSPAGRWSPAAWAEERAARSLTESAAIPGRSLASNHSNRAPDPYYAQTNNIISPPSMTVAEKLDAIVAYSMGLSAAVPEVHGSGNHSQLSTNANTAAKNVIMRPPFFKLEVILAFSPNI